MARIEDVNGGHARLMIDQGINGQTLTIKIAAHNGVHTANVEVSAAVLLATLNRMLLGVGVG